MVDIFTVMHFSSYKTSSKNRMMGALGEVARGKTPRPRASDRLILRRLLRIRTHFVSSHPTLYNI